MNKLFIVSGHSGAGKTSLMRSIMDNEIISFTTREKRGHEVDGIDYIYIDKNYFDHLFYNNGLVEYTEYAGNYYGITREELDNKLEQGHAFVIVDLNGMKQLKAIYPNITSILLYTSYEDAKTNMLKRGDDSEVVERRLMTYHKEVANKAHYDYVIKNKRGHFEDVKNIIRNIISMESVD